MPTTRIDWPDLPAPARALVEEHIGRITAFRTAGAGLNSEVAAVLDTVNGRVFLKGVPLARKTLAACQRREAAVNPFVLAVTPALLWSGEAEGWNLLAFEYVDSRHADYRPGSTDLDGIVEVLNRLHKIAAPDLPEIRRAEQRWSSWDTGDYAELFVGDRLLHTDFAGHNVLIGTDDHAAWMVDWAWATTGAGFIDPACLIIRLIDAGHSAKGAETWARRCDAWAAAEPRAVDAFAEACVRMWNEIAKNGPAVWTRSMARSAHKWAAYRRGMR
ncbi:aminoglycoside phosphotransferase [Catenulispora subtropica]|uniref:Aminoglycoside phosphotransferase n=1 Tax=Catenulispora subtropica TaxID=450798 RepID=A0ABN2SQ83_9ACTN